MFFQNFFLAMQIFYFFKKKKHYRFGYNYLPPPPQTQMNFFAGVPHFNFFGGGLVPCKTPTTFLPSKNYFSWKFSIKPFVIPPPPPPAKNLTVSVSIQNDDHSF